MENFYLSSWSKTTFQPIYYDGYAWSLKKENAKVFDDETEAQLDAVELEMLYPGHRVDLWRI